MEDPRRKNLVFFHQKRQKCLGHTKKAKNKFQKILTRTRDEFDLINFGGIHKGRQAMAATKDILWNIPWPSTHSRNIIKARQGGGCFVSFYTVLHIFSFSDVWILWTTPLPPPDVRFCAAFTNPAPGVSRMSFMDVP